MAKIQRISDNRTLLRGLYLISCLFTKNSVNLPSPYYSNIIAWGSKRFIRIVIPVIKVFDIWPFRRSCTLAGEGLLQGFTDCHCHLLPGVDDGARTMEESLRLLRIYEMWGIREVWLTPHIMEDIPNTVDGLRARFAELQEAYQGPIQLHLAAEHMLDNLFEARLKQNALLPIGKEGRHLLVETSYFNPPMGFYDLVTRICSAGYMPLLAHPERYIYMEEKDYERLRDLNVKFQLNLFSLVGGYGPDARKKAEWLLKEEYYQVCGLDMHRQALVNPDMLQQSVRENVFRQLQRLVENGYEL